jgi:hypothetical protein
VATWPYLRMICSVLEFGPNDGEEDSVAVCAVLMEGREEMGRNLGLGDY